jgi:hypothetical protein
MERFCEFTLLVSTPCFLIKLLGIVNFLNFCGQPSARRNTNKLICEYSDKRSNTILFWAMNLVMFGSPDAHRKVLHWILVDKNIIQLGRYRNFIDRLNSEWNGYAIFVSYTLLYIVDVANIHTSLLCYLPSTSTFSRFHSSRVKRPQSLYHTCPLCVP